MPHKIFFAIIPIIMILLVPSSIHRVFLEANNSGYFLDPKSMVSGDNFIWPALRYSFDRIGFFNISIIIDDIKYSVTNYTILWKTKADLCIATSPAIGDIDNDGWLEAAYSSCDGYLYIVNASNGKILWKYMTGGEFADPTLWDIDLDKYLEIISLGGRGTLYVLNYTGEPEWFYKGRFIRGNPIVADLDNDEKYEVIAGSSDGFLYIFKYNGTVLAKIKLGEYPVQSPTISDVDLDGKQEIVVVEGFFMHIIKYIGMNEQKVYTIDLGSTLVGPPVVYDVNGDNLSEIIVSTRDGHVFIVDPVKGTVINDIKLNATDSAASPSIGDVDGDGEVEIVFGTLQGLFILTKDLKIKYYYSDVEDYTSNPIIVDIDCDSINEIILGEENGYVAIIDVSLGTEAFSEIEWWYRTGGPIMGSPAIADVDKDNLPEILIGSRDYYMYCFKPVATIATPIETISNYTKTYTVTNTEIKETLYNYTTHSLPKPTDMLLRTNTSTTTNLNLSINLPTSRGKEAFKINTYLLSIAIAVLAILVLITYYLTRERR